MDKQAMREEAERLIRETMEKKALTIKQGNTRIETTCPPAGGKRRHRGQVRLQAVRPQARDAVAPPSPLEIA